MKNDIYVKWSIRDGYVGVLRHESEFTFMQIGKTKEQFESLTENEKIDIMQFFIFKEFEEIDYYEIERKTKNGGIEVAWSYNGGSSCSKKEFSIYIANEEFDNQKYTGSDSDNELIEYLIKMDFFEQVYPAIEKIGLIE